MCPGLDVDPDLGELALGLAQRVASGMRHLRHQHAVESQAGRDPR